MNPHSFFGRRKVTAQDLTTLVARKLKPSLRGYSAMHFSGTNSKDWMHPKIRKVLESDVRKHLFFNRFCSIEMFESFIEDAIAYSVKNSSSPAYSDSLKQDITRFALSLPLKKNASFFMRIKITRALLQRLKDKLDNISKLSEQNWKQIKVQGNSAKGIHSEESIYFSNNARDAMAHLFVSHIGWKEVVVNLFNEAKSLEDTFRVFK